MFNNGLGVGLHSHTAEKTIPSQTQLTFNHSELSGRRGDLLAGVYAGFGIERSWFETWPKSLS